MSKAEKKNLTSEDMAKLKAEYPLLTDEELEKVTGGYDAMEYGSTKQPIKKSIDGMGMEK